MQSNQVDSSREFLNELQSLDRTPSCYPWTYTAHETHRYIDQRSNLYHAVSPAHLLGTILRLVKVEARSDKTGHADIRVSACQRFCIVYHRPTITESQLFVQHRDDYFACIELYIDGFLSMSFREPLWPDLQKDKQKANDDIHMLTDCFLALERHSHWHQVQSSAYLKNLETTKIQCALLDPASDRAQAV